LAAGDPAGARKLADALLQAQGLDRATEAEALVALGAAEERPDAALAALSRAMVAAEASGNGRAGAEAAVALAERLGESPAPAQVQQAEFFASMASAELDRMGESGPLRARVELAVARRLLGQRRLDDAEASVRRALAILNRLHGPEHPAVAGALEVLGRVEEQRGRLQEALEARHAAVAALEQSLGPNHPVIAGALLAEAGVQLERRDARAAVALCQRAVELARSGGADAARAEALLASARRQAR
ncbi:MAG TPA: tetratricopeptide repeat protein, partial [Myxococcales bacterium]|nr:tetratricopeptide repeat protein [Myxococcales bacterium]